MRNAFSFACICIAKPVPIPSLHSTHPYLVLKCHHPCEVPDYPHTEVGIPFIVLPRSLLLSSLTAVLLYYNNNWALKLRFIQQCTPTRITVPWPSWPLKAFYKI